MRKLFGLLIAVVAMFFLAMAYSQLARAEDPTCESVLATQIAALVKQDKSKILDMQFELTTLKLAYETLSANRTTVEGYIRKQEALIAKLDDQGIRDQLRVLYQKNGEAADAEQVRTALQESVDKAKKGNYYKKELRFKNKDLSAYVLAHALSDEKSVYDENDVSILWLHSEISEGVEKATFRGSAPANLQEASTLVARLTGVAGTTGISKEEIEQRIAALQKVIGAELDRIVTTFTDDQRKACAEIATCKDCKVTDEHKAAGLGKALRDIGQKLVTDPAAREEAVKKITAELKKEKPEIELDDETESDGVKTKKRPSPRPSATPSPTAVTTNEIPKYLQAPKPSETNDFVRMITNPIEYWSSFGKKTDATANKNAVDTSGKKIPAITVVSDTSTNKPIVDTSANKPVVDTSGKKTPPVALVGSAELGKSYSIDTKNTILKKCVGSMTFVQEGNELKLKFVVTDAKSFKVVCEGAYAVQKKETTAWDDTSAQAECKKQNVSLVQACFE